MKTFLRITLLAVVVASLSACVVMPYGWGHAGWGHEHRDGRR